MPVQGRTVQESERSGSNPHGSWAVAHLPLRSVPARIPFLRLQHLPMSIGSLAVGRRQETDLEPDHFSRKGIGTSPPLLKPVDGLAGYAAVRCPSFEVPGRASMPGLLLFPAIGMRGLPRSLPELLPSGMPVPPSGGEKLSPSL